MQIPVYRADQSEFVRAYYEIICKKSKMALCNGRQGQPDKC